MSKLISQVRQDIVIRPVNMFCLLRQLPDVFLEGLDDTLMLRAVDAFI